MGFVILREVKCPVNLREVKCPAILREVKCPAILREVKTKKDPAGGKKPQLVGLVALSNQIAPVPGETVQVSGRTCNQFKPKQFRAKATVLSAPGETVRRRES